MRDPRPPSVLVRDGAPVIRVVHATCRLAELVGERWPALAVEMLSHEGVHHLAVHWKQFGYLEAPRGPYIRALESYEALVGWTEERMP